MLAPVIKLLEEMLDAVPDFFDFFQLAHGQSEFSTSVAVPQCVANKGT